jgi:hypothetical protein
VAPAHVTPKVARRIELEEQMIFAVEVNQAIGIVGPIASRGKMELRAIGFLIGGGLREKSQRSEEERSG